MFISLSRVVKFSFQDFFRNIWLSLVTIIILSLTFITITFLIIFNVIARQSIAVIQEKIDISVYFKQEIAEEEIKKYNFQLLALPWTKDTTYISREEALENFKNRYSDNAPIMDSLDILQDNPLGATLIVKAKNVDNYNDIIEFLKTEEFKDKILNKNFNDYKKLVDKISLITKKVKEIGIIISIIFALITILIIFYTIKIAIYTHREEVIIKKLVGASNFFVKAPFLIASIFYAVLACLLAAAILYPLLNFINPYLAGFFEGTKFNLVEYFKDNILVIMGWQLLGAIVLNLISSSAALRKYLKN